MNIIFCGDRNWSDRGKIVEELQKLNPSQDLIINGGCRGADQISSEEAKRLGFPVVTVVPRWETDGKAAGPIRNSEMLKLDVKLVIAFHSDIDNSKGTKDCVSKAILKKIPVKVIK